MREPGCRSWSIRPYDSEPIVGTPSDAIVTFRKSGIDALFMHDVF
jgi:predicted NodU family carbamoyl transferase